MVVTVTRLNLSLASGIINLNDKKHLRKHMRAMTINTRVDKECSRRS